MRAPLVLLVLGTFAIAQPADAQKTEDEARLLFNMGLAWTPGTDLWSVNDQPILVPGIGFDQIDLDRNISGGIGVIFSGMYFPKPALGLAGEVFFTGIGTEDGCSIASASPSLRTQQVCASIDGKSQSSSAVLVTLGPVFRVGANQPISPYIRGQVGLLFSNLDPITTTGTISVTDSARGTSQDFSYVVYEDPSNSRITVGFVFGAGLTTILGKGWQLRAEVRDNLVQIATVAGATSPGVVDPVIVNDWKNLWSIVLGADIVLEKKRGHRY
ncbi:MAG TPA: outer membrane beta-barrel protein [Gemmatimonadales bacterium]|nr:outer membrane beta-barrel protein [Gemmatimonadales bacterium]